MSKEDHELFVKTIKPYPFCDDASEKVYIKVINVPMINQNGIKDLNDSGKKEEYDEDKIIHISLINEEMLKYDSYFFKEQSNEKYYRPYFYEFYAHPKYVNKKMIDFLRENQGVWMIGKFYRDKKQLNEQGYSILGDIFFSASPFKIKKRCLCITSNHVSDEFKKEYLNTYDTSSAVVSFNSDKYVEMKKIIDNTLSNSNDFITRIYNVGQGNCVYIRTNDDKRILFDIGYSKEPNSPDWKERCIIRSKFAIMHMKPHLNILSHWDIDHILGVTFAPNNMFNHPWIAPNLNELSKRSVSADRLAKYLCWKNKLYLINDDFLGLLVYNGYMLKLWRGIGRENSLNKANNFGLIIELIGKKRMLLPGDCEYKMFPNQLKVSSNRYNYLMVPHHCSNMKLVDFINTNFCNDYAIISVGNNSYNPKHPCSHHIDKLQSAGYQIIQTAGNRSIDIPSINNDKLSIYIKNINFTLFYCADIIICEIEY